LPLQATHLVSIWQLSAYHFLSVFRYYTQFLLLESVFCVLKFLYVDVEESPV
jgi:hypothetical protein